MSPPTPPDDRPLFSVVDILLRVGLLVGPIVGATVGYSHYGVSGALLGSCAGLFMGPLAVLVCIVGPAAVVVATWAVAALVTDGRAGFWDFIENGPKGLRGGDPPTPPPTEG